MIIYLNGNFTYLYSADFYLLSVASVEAAVSVEVTSFRMIKKKRRKNAGTLNLE